MNERTFKIKFAKELLRKYIHGEEFIWGIKYTCIHCDSSNSVIRNIEHKKDCIILKAREIYNG